MLNDKSKVQVYIFNLSLLLQLQTETSRKDLINATNFTVFLEKYGNPELPEILHLLRKSDELYYEYLRDNVRNITALSNINKFFTVRIMNGKLRLACLVQRF